MNQLIKSIRPFIGAKDFNISRNFYTDLGFKEYIISPQLSYFELKEIGFYLQDAYVKDWVDNTMVFVEVGNTDEYWNWLISLKLELKYEKVRLVPPRHLEWGKECFLHDPSGILWHFGEFK
jgi:hypothetical protein